MHLPHLPSTHVTHFEGIPVVPFALLFLDKLQAWDDHCKGGEDVSEGEKASRCDGCEATYGVDGADKGVDEVAASVG